MVPLYPHMQLSIMGRPMAENTSSWREGGRERGREGGREREREGGRGEREGEGGREEREGEGG